MTNDSQVSVIFTFSAEEVENPYFELLYEALRSQGASVIEGDRPIFFPLTRNILSHPEGDVLHLDWIYGFYMTDGYTGYKLLDDALTYGRAFFFFIDLLISALLPISIIWTVHNKRHHERNYPRIERLINEYTFILSDNITVKCEKARQELQKTYKYATPEKMVVIPDGNYIGAYENKVSKSEARTELSINEDTFVYLFFGIIREYKGVLELIEAFDAVRQPNTELWIVGNIQSNKLEKKITSLSSKDSEVHTVLRFVERENVQYYLNAADVLVLPYRDILNSGSVHLGLSFGIPIIAPRLGCIPEVLPLENKFLYGPDKDNGLQRKLKDGYSSSNLRSIGTANYEKAVNQTWEKAAEKLIILYEKTAHM